MRPIPAFSLPPVFSRFKMSAPQPSTVDLTPLWPAPLSSSAPLVAFLAASRATLSAPPTPTSPHIFLGNESADLDSTVSAVVLAYAASLTGVPSAPIINCARSDFALRADAAALLHAARIPLASLSFVEDLPLTPPRVTLVDHNDPAAHQFSLSPSITAIVDHHADSGRFPDASPRIVERVGSCATLVYSLANDLDPCATALLLCAVLMDTANLKRGAEKDSAAAAKMMAALGLAAGGAEPLYTTLRSIKQAQGHLSTADLLRRDYKRFAGGGRLVGIASAGIGFEEWAGRRGEGEQLSVGLLQAWARDQGIDVLVIMTHYSGNREILVCPASASEAQFARGMTAALRGDDLHLEKMDVSSLAGTVVEVFRQQNVLRTRKAVAPIVLRYLETRAA